jgi:hypothetical protein
MKLIEVQEEKKKKHRWQRLTPLSPINSGLFLSQRLAHPPKKEKKHRQSPLLVHVEQCNYGDVLVQEGAQSQS